jgi:hypothetical protein
MKTTLNKIRKHHPCESGWTKLLATLNKTKADDVDVSFLTILESNGLDDALWCLRSTPEYNRDSRLFAVWCARQVQHLMQDERSLNALDVAERHADGLATDEELAAARAAARAAGAAAGAAGAACAAARDANRAAACDAACDAASWAASWAAASAADAASAAQKAMFIKMCEGNAPWQGEIK